MTAIKVRAAIDADGTLRLAVPVGLPAGDAEVFVVVQPDPVEAGAIRAASRTDARSGLFTDDPRCHALDVDAALREMNDQWKAKFEDVV